METETLLPIGSVVLLYGGEKKIMIYGRMQEEASTKKMYDYTACLYPEGNISQDFTYLFNHSDIEEVIFRGYSDADDEVFLEYLSNLKEEKRQPIKRDEPITKNQNQEKPRKIIID